MTTRDRMVLIGVIVLVVIGAGWMLVVSPERQKASQLATQVATAQTELTTAATQLENARNAQAQYSAAYASIVSLGKAVPPSQEVPSLIYQLAQATNEKNVQFSSIATAAATGGSAGAASASAAASATAAAAGFTQMPFTFVFEGSFFNLEHLFHQLSAQATRTTSGSLQVSGRLLTIQSVKLAPSGGSGASPAAGASSSSSALTGTITATAYELPSSQGLTAGATPTSPAGAATPAAASSPSGSPTTPATVKVTP